MAVTRKFQNSFTSGELSPGVYARVDVQKYASGCKELLNAVVYPHGGAANRPGTYFVDELPGDGLLFPFIYSVEQSYVLAFFDPSPGVSASHKADMRVYKDGAAVLSGGEPLEIETPFYVSELPKVKFAQSADVLFMVHPNHKPVKLTRTSHTNWTFTAISFLPSVAAPANLSAAASGFTDTSGTHTATHVISYKVSAVDERESESLPSDAARATQGGSTEILVYWPEGAKVVLSWTAVQGAKRYEVYKNVSGYYAWIGSADSNTFTDNNIDGDGAIGPKDNRDPFSSAGNYPGAVGIYQQRLIFGRTDNEPQTVWCSETGSFDSMAVANPLRDDSAITATVDSRQMNEIRHFIPLRDMLMLTSGAEFKMSGGGEASGALTPTGIRFDIQSYWGASDVPPIVSGTSVLLVENSGKVVRDLHYALSEDGYTGSDVSLLAEHLLESPIVDWAYQQDPFSTVWICLADGTLLTMTYMREQEVTAWSRHESAGGRFLSVCSIREKSEDNVYFITAREVGGETRRFVEFQERWNYGNSVKDAFFVDCGLKYDGSPVSVVTGMEHLAGREVVALADGSVVRNLTVQDDGSVHLPFAASKVIVGLGRTFRIRTLDPEIRAENGSTLGDPKNVVRTVVCLRESRGFAIGPETDRMTPIKFPVPDKWGAPPPLFSGNIAVVLQGHHRNEASIVMEQTDPLPVTVLAVESTISVG